MIIDRKSIARSIPAPKYADLPSRRSISVGPNQSAGAFYHSLTREDPAIVHISEIGGEGINWGLTAGEATALSDLLLEYVASYNERVAAYEEAVEQAEAEEAEKAVGDKVNYETAIGSETATVRGFTEHGKPAMYLRVLLGDNGQANLLTDSEAIALADALQDTVEARKA